MKVIAYPQTHWDREWYQPFEEFRLRLIDVIDNIICDLKSGELKYFYFDGQTIALEDYFELFPDKKTEIKQLIKDGKLSVGPWYALADEFLVTGESLIRNLLLGISQSQSLGCADFIGYLPDAFGHCSDMPRIFSSFGIKNAVVWRGAGENQSEFIWKSRDNSEVIATYLIEGYFQDILNWDCPINKKIKTLETFLKKIKKYSIGETLLLPCGGDHLAPCKNFEEQIELINSKISDFDIKTGSIFGYIKDMQKISLKTHSGELRDNCRNFILPSGGSSRIYLKQQNASATWNLAHISEPLQSQLEITGETKKRTPQIKHAWKMLIQNHPHDSICGCSIDSVHDEMETRYAKINQIASGITTRALFDVAKTVSSGDIVIYNASNYDYSGIVTIQTPFKLPKNIQKQYNGKINKFPQDILMNIHRAPVQEDIEEYNEYLIYIENLKSNSLNILSDDYKYKESPKSVNSDKNSISNGKIKISVEKDGQVKFTDLEKNITFNNLLKITDLADAGDTYNFAPLKKDTCINARLNDFEIIEKGKLRNSLKLNFSINIPEKLIKNDTRRSKKKINHKLELFLSVCANSKRVEARLEWENKSKNHILQIKFNTGQKIFKTVSEDSLGFIERNFDPDYSIKSAMPAKKGQELKVNIAPMQRFVSANNLGITTKGLHEYGVDNQDLYITLLRSVGKLSNGSLATRGTPAGPPLIVNGAQCLKKCEADFAFFIPDNTQDMYKQSDEFMGNTVYEIGTDEKKPQSSSYKQFISFNNEKIYIFAKKIPENNERGIIIRALNLANEQTKTTITTDLNFKSWVETNSLEEPSSITQPISEPLLFKPNELKTILVNFD